MKNLLRHIRSRLYIRWRINYYFSLLKNRISPPKPLLTPEQHKEVIDKSRRIDNITEQVCKQLKCKPDEMLQRITKVQQHIGELEAEIAKHQPKPE